MLVEDSIIYQPTPAVGDYHRVNLQGFAPEGILLLDNSIEFPAIRIKSSDELLIGKVGVCNHSPTILSYAS